MDKDTRATWFYAAGESADKCPGDGESFATVTQVPADAELAGYYVGWEVFTAACFNSTASACGGWDGLMASSDFIKSVRARPLRVFLLRRASFGSNAPVGWRSPGPPVSSLMSSCPSIPHAAVA